MCRQFEQINATVSASKYRNFLMAIDNSMNSDYNIKVRIHTIFYGGKK